MAIQARPHGKRRRNREQKVESWHCVSAALARYGHCSNHAGSTGCSSPASASIRQNSRQAAGRRAPRTKPAQSMAIPATLAKSVDSKKVKAGDEIDAKLSVSLTGPSGTTNSGGLENRRTHHDAKSKAKGDSAIELAFAFEKIVLKNGQEMPLQAVPQAIGMPANAADAAAFPKADGPKPQDLLAAECRRQCQSECGIRTRERLATGQLGSVCGIHEWRPTQPEPG